MGKWTKRICEEPSFLFWFFFKLGRRAHHDRFFPTFGIILAQTSLRRQLFKVSNIRNGIHCISEEVDLPPPPPPPRWDRVNKWGLCEYVIAHTILGGSPVILWISLGGKPKWLPLEFGCLDAMRTSPIPKATISQPSNSHHQTEQINTHNLLSHRNVLF